MSMFRAPDAWEEAEAAQADLSCGFAEGDIESKGYAQTGRVLGKGGFGNVVTVKRLANNVEFACKTVEKRLDVPHLSSAKQEQHLNNIKREVAILSRLRAALNVVHLEEVFEDKKNVYIVMQQCTGGQLLAGVGKRHYSERTVASYMRAVLRTLSQCHHHRILHRDIKPGNFMLLHEAEDSPVLAIDFGLAVFFDPKHLPVRDLGLEGTPHYIAPECLVSECYPASDVWAAGVMAYQLLSARFPFDDWKNPRNPALSQLWKSILTEEPKLHGSSWDDVSDGAKDFIRKLLNKDPLQRITAQQALEHPWIQGRKVQRKEGKPLAGTIVQRLQRFGTESPFKRTVLDMIANDLLQRHFANMRQKQQQQQQQLPSLASLEGSLRRRNSSYGSLASQNNLRVLAAAFRERSARNGNMSGLNPDKPHTVHASNEAGALLKPQQLSNLQRAVPDFRHTSVGHHLNNLGAVASSPDSGDGSAHKPGDFKPSSDDPNAVQDHHNKWYKLIDDMQEQRMRQQKIQRLMLDTSGRGQTNYYKTHPDKETAAKAQIESIKEGAPVFEVGAAPKDAGTSKPSKDKDNQSLARRSIFAEFEEQQAQTQRGSAPPDQSLGPPPEEEGRRGRGAFAALFGKAAAPFANLSKRDTGGGPAKSTQHNVMPSICTVKGAHQHAPTPPQQPQQTQQQQQQQQQGDVQVQTGNWPRHPLLAAGMLGETKASPDSIASSPPALGGAAGAPTGLREAPQQAQQAQQPQQAQQDTRSHDIAAQLARLKGGDEPSGDSVREGQQMKEGRQEGTVSKGALFTVMGKLMGGETQLSELQEALKGMQYGADIDKVSFSQVSEGLQKLGYKLQPHEVEVLLREVSVGGDNLSQSAFLASQADWREFQRNHREEWLECLRNAFQGLDKNKDGRICADEVLAALRDKLPEEEVNLAVQETLMDAAVMTEEGMDFNDFQALFQSESMADLGAYESGLSNSSTHGGTNMSRQSSDQPEDPLPSMSPDTSSHFQPRLGRLSERE